MKYQFYYSWLNNHSRKYGYFAILFRINNLCVAGSSPVQGAYRSGYTDNGAWCNGSMGVSKTLDISSILIAPATVKERR